jgi:purine-nucleoside phosphorylase
MKIIQLSSRTAEQFEPVMSRKIKLSLLVIALCCLPFTASADDYFQPQNSLYQDESQYEVRAYRGDNDKAIEIKLADLVTGNYFKQKNSTMLTQIVNVVKDRVVFSPSTLTVKIWSWSM